MHPFSYSKVSSLDEAQRILAADPDALPLAGGHTIIPTIKQRLASPSTLVDVTNIPELSNLSLNGDNLSVGAAVIHDDVANSPVVRSFSPALADLASRIGDPHVRRRGTIGGSLANNDPSADYPAAVLALNAVVHTSSRSISADDFFQGLFTTSLEQGEIIRSIEFPKPQRAAYVKFPNPASRYALAASFVALLADGSVRVAITGVGDDGVFRAKGWEEPLNADFSKDAVLNGKDFPHDRAISDLHAQGDYRAHLAKILTARAVAAAS